jgi:murein DD-endopeptidase
MRGNHYSQGVGMKTYFYTLLLFVSLIFMSGCSPFPSSKQVNYQQSQYRYPALHPKKIKIVQAAHKAIGTRYKWGGKTPREGFDCSGLTLYTYAKSGIKIPRTAARQRDTSRQISYSQLQPGDLIFFKTGKRSNHVGIYIGNGEFIQSGSSTGVKIDKLSNPYWKKRFVKFGTFI